MEDSLTEIVGSITALAKQRDEARAKYDEFQKVALDVLDAVTLMAPGCPVCSPRRGLVMKKVGPGGGPFMACDEHAEPDAVDLTYAPALRRLRALAGVRCGAVCAVDTKREDPCVLPEGHDGSHRDKEGRTWRNMRRG